MDPKTKPKKINDPIFGGKIKTKKKDKIMGTKKNYTAEFKAKVVIAAIKGEKGTAEICSEFNIPSTNLVDWKNKAIENLHKVFIAENEHFKKQKNAQEQINSLHKIIGEMAIENNFLKKKLQK